MPREVWLRLLSEAQESVDVLVFSGTFFAQTQPRVARMLTDAAERGAAVRLCFGEPESEAVAIRDREEGIAGTLAAKIRSALTYYEPLLDIDGCEVRLHATTLYASLFRYDDEIPLVVPEVNPHAIGQYRKHGIIANPNCSTIQMLVALKPLHDAAGIERINVSTYQSVSGAGKEGVDELAAQTAELLNGRSVEAKVIAKQIAFNCVPQIDKFQDNGYT